jgi:hypothetical protein
MEAAKSYYEMWANFQNEHPNTFPSTWYELDWIKSWDFKLEERYEEPHHFNSFRRQFLCSVARLVSKQTTSGDFIEFGTFNGLSAHLILNNSDRNLHIVDSFEGLSSPSPLDGNHWKVGDMSRTLEHVRLNLFEFQNRISFYKGFIPEILSEIKADGFALAHVDLDLYEPTIQTLKWLDSRMNRQSFIVCDDFGFSTCPGATKACLEFVQSSLRWNILPLPIGGCLFLNLFEDN